MKKAQGSIIFLQNNFFEWTSGSIKLFCHQMILPIFLLSLVGCQSFTGGSPEWVENPKSVYPESNYLVAVGAGDTRRAAENSAAGNLSRIFEAHIQSDERILDKSRETNSSFERTTDFTADINILSAQTLYNIQHAEAWKDDKGRYHAVAYLERRETAAIYRDMINKQTTRVNFLLASAKTTTDLLKRYATLRTANRHATEADSLLRQLKVIHSPSVAGLTPSYSVNQLRKALADSAKKIKVSIRIQGDNENRMTQSVEAFITRYGFVVGQPMVLDISGRVAVTDTGEREQGLVFVRYELALQIKDSEGTLIASVGDKGREAHKSLEQARVRSFRTLGNAIQANGAQRLDAYFDSLIDQQ
ncbi:MAG: LPP20 family lipoprotein [Pontiella sp.]